MTASAPNGAASTARRPVHGTWTAPAKQGVAPRMTHSERRNLLIRAGSDSATVVPGARSLSDVEHLQPCANAMAVAASRSAIAAPSGTALSLAALLVSAGCGDGDDDSGAEPTAATAAATTMTTAVATTSAVATTASVATTTTVRFALTIGNKVFASQVVQRRVAASRPATRPKTRASAMWNPPSLHQLYVELMLPAA